MNKKTDNERRFLAVRLSNSFVIDMLRKGFEIKNGLKCTVGVPEDAVMISDYIDQLRQRTVIVFYHPSFEIVDDACEIPVLSVSYELINPPIESSTTE